MAPSHVLTTTLSRVTRPTRHKVDNILDAHRIALAASKDDASLLVQMNKVGAPRIALPTFVTYPRLFAYWARGSGMIWDANSQTHANAISARY